MRSTLHFAILLPIAIGCAAPTSDDGVASANSDLTNDISSMQEDGAGTYTVTCRDGHVERVVTTDRIRTDKVCAPSSVDTSLFDPASCPGAALTPADAMALAQFDVVLGKTSVTFGTAKHAVRVRECNTSGACGSWRNPSTPPALVVEGWLVRESGCHQPSVLCGGSAGTVTHEEFWTAITPSGLDGLLDVDVRLELVNNHPLVHLLGKVSTERGTYAWNPTGTFDDGRLVLFNDSEPTYKNATIATSAYDAALPSRVGLDLDGKVTASCARWAAAQRQGLSDSTGNSFIRESELVVFAQH